MKLGFGIDSGGTRTRLALFDCQDGREILRVEGKPANPHSVGMETAQNTIADLILNALTQAQAEVADLACGCLVGAGLGRQAEKQAFQTFFSSLLPCPVHVCDDGEGLLAGALGAPVGYGLIVGTGSYALARDVHGRSARAGGLGHMLGDEGSACWLGWQAMRRALKSQENRDLPTGMMPDLLRHFKVNSAMELVPLFHQRFNKAQVAAATPLVIKFAQHGDTLARDIVHQAAQQLCLMVLSVLNQLALPEQRLAVGGGLMEEDNLLRRLLMERLQREAPTLEIIETSKNTALQGACLLARSL